MSAPPARPSQIPLRQQSSQIRVVPYSPPRPADSSEDTTQPQSGLEGRRSNQNSAKSRSDTALSLSPSPLPLLAKSREEDVSASNSATSAGASGDGPKSRTGTTVAPASPSSNVASLAAINAPTRGRLSTSSYTTHTSQSSRYSASSHFSDAEPSSSSGPTPSPTGPRCPTSRRRNFVAVLNEDKTFSLVPQRPQPNPEPEPQQSQDPRSSSSLSDYGGTGGPGGDFRSPQLPYFPTTPRASQSSSHEGYSSYASSHIDRPTSSLTSTGTIPDRSITPYTPVPSSPGSSMVQENLTEDPITDSSASPWNYRIVGGLRKVPQTPDPKGKGKELADDSPPSDTTETPLPVVASAASTTDLDDDRLVPHSTREEQASAHSNTPSAGSERTNYVVFREEQESPESQLDPNLREQTSFNSVQTASTEFETTNYHIYGHSGSEESTEALPEPPAGAEPEPGSSSRLLVPPLRTQPSFRSIGSASTTSEATNYKVYGHSSPGLSPVPEAETPQDTGGLRPSPSFLSATSTISETTNYKVYGRSSPTALASVESFNPPSPSGSYTPLLGSSSSTTPFCAPEEEAGPSNTTRSEPNYVVHGDLSPEPSADVSPDFSPPGTAERQQQQPRTEYSQESLVVEPLQPRRQTSEERLGYYNPTSRSTDNLRTKKSSKSVQSISSIVNEEEAAENFFAGQAFLNAPTGQFESSIPGPSDRQRQLDEQRERERQQRGEASWAEASGDYQGPMALPTTPHQWSSQLSTVVSESEPDSSTGSVGTRQGSFASGSLPGSNGRRSSRGWSSSHSRQMLSISSSLAGELENASRSRSHSQTESLDRPSPIWNARGGFNGMVRDHDEHGDGLADLQQITPRPSRSRLSDLFSNSNSSDRNLHSSASSRSNSFSSSSIPTWARLYYGSGERRFLRSTSISSVSDFGSSRPASAQHTSSPVTDHFPLSLYSPRRRPREGGPEPTAKRRSAAGSMDIQPISTHDDDLGIRRGIRRVTSSVWSPHLRRDVRATNRYSIWDPPSVAWSAESGMFGRRNLQVVLFVVGFIFPFAWMIGALLPLPKPSPLAMVERYSSISDLGIRSRSHEYERHIETVDELRYQNARWWRTLNRCMSVIGILIIGAVVGLAVAAVKEGWGTVK